MRLQDYIRQIGTAEFAERFKITKRAAEAYRYGVRKPRPGVAERIVKNSPVTWEGIYRPDKSDRPRAS